MHDNFNLLTVQNELGYTFRDASLIKTAFIHPSFEAKGEESSARLTYLGKRLLPFVLSDYITSRLPYTGEKELAFQEESYISALGAEKYIKEHSLARFVMLSELNEPLRLSAAVGRDVFCAIIAAIYRDGGMPALKSFLIPMLRSCDGGTHYRPNTAGKIITSEADNTTDGTHIRNERLRRPAKNASISITRAQTVEETHEPESAKKEKGLSRLLKKKEEPNTAEASEKKKTKKKTAEKVPEPAEEDNATESAAKRTFIRDPFAPVKLSDDLRNFKPKRPSRYDPAPVPQVTEPVAVTAPSAPADSDDSDQNYKSLLQEYVQKNIRTANVLLCYNAKQSGRGKWTASITLQDRSLAVGQGECKKEAEKDAARIAYKAITSKGSDEHKWFVSLNGTVTVSEPSADYVSKINLHFQKLNRASTVPVSYEKRSSGKRGVFLIAVMLDGKEIASGSADNLKQAKQNAAQAACKVLGI